MSTGNPPPGEPPPPPLPPRRADQEQPRPPVVGSMFGAYRIDGVIGVGGMGMVYAAHDPKLNRQVALKVVLGHYAMSPGFMRRFQHEASVLARLDSPHVISVYDHGEQDGCPFIVVQYAAGGDLGRLLQQGALSRLAAVDLCAQVADGLVAAHGVGVVHRDVKPANVLLRDDRIDRLHAYLCDFGVALTEASGLTTPGSVAGTWNYLAPERTRGESGSPSSDVYAVGCLLWECLTGAPPYAGSDVEVAMEHLTSPVPQLVGTDEFTEHTNHVLGRALAKEPADRYPSATELRDDLRALAASIAPSPATAGGRGRTRTFLALGAAAVLAIAAGVTAVVLTRGGDGSGSSPAAPAPAATRIQGDVDGDGFGDVVLNSLTETTVFRSDGTTLAAQGTEVAGISQPTLTGHFGDADDDSFVFVDRFPPTVSLQIADLDGAGPTSLLRTEPADILSYPDAAAGDFDGDGLDDVMVRVRDGETSEISVALNKGDGTFATSTTWSDDELVEGGFVVGDLDQDGKDDLVQVTSGSAAVTRNGRAFTVLHSTGTSFETAGVTEVGLDASFVEAQIADPDGDGDPELVTLDTLGSGPGAAVWEWNGSGFDKPTSWLDGEGDVAADDDDLALSDVDGDGSSDLVTAGDKGIHIFLSTGEAFEDSPDWATDVTPPENSDLVASSRLLTFLNTN